MAYHFVDTTNQAVSCELRHWSDQIATQKLNVNSAQEMVPIPRKGPETQWPEGTDGTPIVDMASNLRLWDP